MEMAAGGRARRRFMERLSLSGLGGLGMGAMSALGATPVQAATGSEVRQWDGETDLLVMGSGAAGMAAAIEGARQGLEVTVLEKFQLAGGSSSLSGGVCYMGGGTPLQKALGFDDSVENMYHYLVAAAGVHAEPARIQLYCEGSLAHFDWLNELGVRYATRFSSDKELSHGADSLYYSGGEQTWPFREQAKPAPRGHVPPAHNQTGGRELMKLMHAAAARLGVKVQLRMSAEQLIRASDGRVIGLVVEDAAGQRLNLRARRGVVLAAGGFIHNRPMLQRYAPELASSQPAWGRAGDLGMGILMGLGAGGNLLRMDHGFAVLPLYPSEEVLKGVVVNRFGQRFINEDAYYGGMGHAWLFQQQGHGFLVVDGDSDYPGPDYRFTLAAEAASIEALETALKLPPGALVNTVGYYNQHAARGEDPQFRKQTKYLATLTKPPFKAYDLTVGKAFCTVHTFGGLEIDLDGRVLDGWGSAIPGLYAAGRTSASLPVAPYLASGLSIGDGTFFGRRAGAHAAGKGA
ncbi:MAG: FAD-dependent oxidoreductase [Thauera sp.]|jgi:succinate dehydrogenase/fumarate reductase flavoprotein subunit|nr:FAD-dependent oxidoreductase [Thauera sp.]